MSETVENEVVQDAAIVEPSIKNQFYQVIIIYLVVQAIIGIIGLEYAWYRASLFRKVDEKRDAQFPQFRR